MVSASEELEPRLQRIESAIAHLQHDYDQLHQVALSLQQELRLVIAALERLQGRLDTLEESPEVRSPREERPPHY